MSEVPPPTRRARKDAPATVGAPPAGGVEPEAPVLPGPSGTTPAIPGSAAAAAASFAAGSGGAGTPGGAQAPGGAGMPTGAGMPGGAGMPTGAGTPISDASTPSPYDDDPERMATAQLEMAAFGDHLIPYVPPQPPTPRSLAPWALVLAILALAASLFTGWLLLLGVGGVVVASMSLRRPHDSRRTAGWALSLALLSLVFSAGWLIWGFSQLAVV